MAQIKVLPGVLLFFRRAGPTGEREYLLHLRKNTGFHDGDYSVVGGHVETGKYETYVQCAIREAAEEVGIKLSKSQLKPVHIVYRKWPGELRPDFCFLIDRWPGRFANREPRKHGPPEWFSAKKLPKNTVPYVLQAIKNIEKGVFYSEFGFKN